MTNEPSKVVKTTVNVENFEGKTISAKGSSYESFSGKRKTASFNLEADIFDIFSSAKKGDKKSILLLCAFILFSSLITILPFVIGISAINAGEDAGYLGLVFGVLALITIVQNLIISWKRRKKELI